MDVDPALALAMAMHSNPGGYACLLGSGVSQGVPDGWTVLLDLVGKVAAHHGYQGDEPLTWYREQSDGPVGYSSVLEDLTDTPEERVALLRPYFEPVNEEGAVEAIEPSTAHRAIARLIAAGYIRVVITTNFDRLLERALDEVGVAPTVLSTPSAMAGARPLHLQRACIIKVNGDYLDPTFLNTGAELDRYEAPVDVLLDRVIDEYGLVSAGWSGTWDAALRHAIERCPTRRLGTYVIEPFSVSEEMDRLVENRRAHIVAETADDFFTRLEEVVASLEEIDIAPPASIAIAVATAKRALSDGSPIRLHDLVSRELRGLREKVGDWQNSGDWSVLEAIVRRLDAVLARPQALVATLAYWGDSRTDELWLPVVLAMAEQRVQAGTSTFIDLRYYPASALLYAAGVAMMATGRLADLDRILRRRVRDLFSGKTAPVASQLAIARALSGLEQKSPYDLAAEHLRDQLTPIFADHLILADEQIERAYERFELLIFAVAYDASGEGDPFVFATVGRPRVADGFVNARPVVIVDLEREGGASDGKHPWLTAGLFEGDEERLSRHLQLYLTRYQQLRAGGYQDPSRRPRPSPFA